MMMPATTAPKWNPAPPDNHGKNGNPEGLQRLEIESGDIADDAAGSGGAQPRRGPGEPEHPGTEMPTDMEANWSSDTARMEMPTVDFLKNHENPPIMIGHDNAHQLGPGDGHPTERYQGPGAETGGKKN
jgi:hypothetical protein